jgi:hypothetical protein
MALNKRMKTAAMGALNLYFLLFTTALGLDLFLALASQSSYMGHGEIFGVLLAEGISLLLHPLTVFIVLYLGGTIAYNRYGKREEKKWSFAGKRQLALFLILSMVLAAVCYTHTGMTALKYALYQKKAHRITASADVKQLLAQANIPGSGQRHNAFRRLGEMIYYRNVKSPDAKKIEFLNPKQEQEVFDLFLNGLYDPDYGIKNIALDYMDDLLNLEAGKKLLTPAKNHTIRQAYLKVINDSTAHINLTALRNIGNLLNESDKGVPLFYKEQVVKRFASLRSGKHGPGGFSRTDFAGSLVMAMNHRPEDFIEVEEWVAEELENPKAQSRFYDYSRRQFILFLLAIDSGTARQTLQEHLKLETSPDLRRLIRERLDENN